MVFNDAYHAYAVDIASPANIDLLAVSGMLASACFLWSGRTGWFLAAALFTYFTRPTGLMFLLLLGIGIAVADRRDRGARIWVTAVAVTAVIVLAAVYNLVLDPSGMGNIADRLKMLRFDDYGRLLFLVVPAGILTPIALFMLPAHDAISRSLTLVTLGYFAFFYVVAFVVLHHFTPAMVLPLVVFWRVVLRGSCRPVVTGATAAAAAVALVMVQPRCYLIDRTMRTIGHTARYEIGNYDGSYVRYREAFEQKGLFDSLFRPWYQVENPSAELIGSAWLLVHYSARGDTPAINYIVRSAREPAPAGFTRVADNGTGAVYVKDAGRWERDRYSPPRTDCRSPSLEIPKETIHERWGAPAGNYTVDLQWKLQRVMGWLQHLREQYD